MMNLETVLRTVSPHFLNLSERIFAYGPQGKLVLRNLEEHWFAHCVTMSRHNVFLYDGNIADTLHLLRRTKADVTPFALATFATSKTTWNESALPAGGKISSHRIAKLKMLVDASESTNLLHKIQRERKVWWRKLAQYPSRFVLAEAKKARNVDVTDIEARFPFGSVAVETITHHSDTRKLFPQTESGKDIVADVHMIEHVASLDWGCLALLCDSYMSDNSSSAHIHPKLSPYKTTFFVNRQGNETDWTDRTEGTDSEVEDLNQFVLYLNNMIRGKGISTILTNDEQIIEMYLIPFIVSVDKTSLKNGIVHVKSRSTTLHEAVHITDLVKYIALRSS